MNKIPYCDRRPREYLHRDELDALMKAAYRRREWRRDVLVLELLYNHAMRASELLSLQWNDINWTRGTIQFRRAKSGLKQIHYLTPQTVRRLASWRRAQTATHGESPFIFTTCRGLRLARRTLGYIVEQSGIAASISFPVHPHMLRHSKGFHLANEHPDADIRKIAHYFGHKRIDSTLRYTEVLPETVRDYSQTTWPA